MEIFNKYRRSQVAELADWYPGFDMERVSVSVADKEAGSPKLGDKITRNPVNHADQWLVAADYFTTNFESVTISERGEQDADEDTCDSVRGILQILRGKPGCTFADVRKHCEMRGDDMEWWPAWIDLQEGYVTEHGAAKMIYDVMSAHLSRKEPK